MMLSNRPSMETRGRTATRYCPDEIVELTDRLERGHTGDVDVLTACRELLRRVLDGAAIRT